MGALVAEVPIIDMVGPHVSMISGVTFERAGEQVLINVYLESKVSGVVTREIISKYAMTFGALAESTLAAAAFMKECTVLPVMGVLARHKDRH